MGHLCDKQMAHDYAEEYAEEMPFLIE